MTAPISHTDLSDLIGRIYDCTLDPSLWDGVLVEIKNLLECQTAVLHLNDLRKNRFLISKWVGVDTALQAQVAEHLPEMHGWLADHLALGRTLDEPLVISRDLSRSARDNSSYIQQCWRPNGLVDTIEHFLILTPTRVGGLGLARHERQGVITEREAELGRLLLPHVRRAVMISDVLDAKAIEAERMSDALDALSTGIVFANEDIRIVHANRAGEAMLRAGGALRDFQGSMCAERAAASVELKEAVTAAARNESGIGRTGLAVRLTDDYEQPIVAHVLPLANGRVRTRLEPEAVAAIFIKAPIDEAACANAIVRSFGLTPAEARVLSPILAGRTVPEAAVDVGVATTTARTHLNNIFAKTGVARQSDLIRLAAQIAPPAS